MEGLGVIVECSLAEQGTTENLSCSGIYLGKGIVLTHGTIVIDILRDKRAQLLLQELELKGCVQTRNETDLLNTVLQDTQSNFQVVLPSEQLQNEITNVCCSSASVDSFQDNKENHCNLMYPEDQRDQFEKRDKNSLYQAEGLKNISSDICEITEPSNTLNVTSSNFWSLPAIVERLFIQPGIRKSVPSIMPSSQGWKLMEDIKEKQYDADFESLILSTFVLLKTLPDKNGESKMIVDTNGINEDVISVTERMIPLTDSSCKGTSVYVESSPFGSLSPRVFLNSLSQGIISNVCNSAGDILLTDARCVMGSEGAPVYAVLGGKKSLCGLVISPFCWRNGEWVGLTLLASAKPVLQVLHSVSCRIDSESRETKHFHSQDKLDKMENSISNVDVRLIENIRKEHEINVPGGDQKIWKHSKSALKERYLNQGIDNHLNGSVVAVCSGGGWGSGIVISTSPGIILTCAHVTYPSASGSVQILLSDGRSLPGQVIHQTQPRTLSHQNIKSRHGSDIWDLAVIVTTRPLPFALPLASQLPPKGSSVIVAGYGIISPRCLPTPTLSRGVISKVVSFPVNTLHWPSYQFCRRANQIRIKELDKDETNVMVDRIHDDLQQIEKSMTYVADIKVNRGYKDLLTTDLGRKADHELLDTNTCMNGNLLINSDNSGMVPLLMQTTCTVYAGTSGGPVLSFHPHYGLQVIGVIVCNTCDTANKATFPQINMAIPTTAIFEILKAFVSSGDKMVLRYLNAECTAASHLWTLGLTPQSQL